MSIPWWWNEIPKNSKEDSFFTLNSNSFTLGEKVAELESELAREFNFQSVVACNSGTSALVISLLLAGIGPGDEVLVPALTWIATAQAVLQVGAKPVVVDVDEYTLCISPGLIEEKINSRSRAIIPVYFNGRTPSVDQIVEIAKKYELTIIEDRCKAMGTTFASRGGADFALTQCFSLGMISYISVGYGGFIGLRDKDLAAKARQIRDHGMNRNPEKYVQIGGNFKISDFVAALGISQLKLVESRVLHTLNLLSVYEKVLGDSKKIFVDNRYSRHKDIPTYVDAILSKDIDSEWFVSECRKSGIQVNPYHPSISNADYLDSECCPVAESFTGRLIALPSGPGMTIENAKFAASQIQNILRLQKYDL